MKAGLSDELNQIKQMLEAKESSFESQPHTLERDTHKQHAVSHIDQVN